MNAKQLAAMEFKLSLTPAGIAARYIRWMHESLGTDEPNPLAGWLERLDADLEERHRLASHRVYRGAERQIFALVGMYVSALLGWIEELCAALSLDVVVTACIKCYQRLSPELSMRLTEQQHSLSICAAVMKSIEDDHLRESVMPDTLCSALDPNQLKSSTVTPSLDRNVKLAAEASSRVTTLFATALATANLCHCHELLLSLAQATMTLGDRRRDHELSMHFLDQASAIPRQPKKNLVARANHYARSTRGIKPRRPTKKTTSTTRVKKPKLT